MEKIDIRTLRDTQKDKMQKLDNSLKKISLPASAVSLATGAKNKRIVKKIANLVLLFMFVFIVGGLGGIWTDRFFLPYVLVKYPDLNRYEYLKGFMEKTVILRETEDIKISEEQAISDIIERTRPVAVSVMAKGASGTFERTGAGIILTSDGYIIAPLKSLYAKDGKTLNKEFQVELKNGKTYAAQVVAQDTNYSLVMLKIAENNLPVIPYANPDELKLGEKLVILDDAVATDIISKFINNYAMPGSTDSRFQKRIQISQKLEENSAGCAVISLEGKLVGVEQGANIVIPISEVKDFIDKNVGKK